LYEKNNPDRRWKIRFRRSKHKFFSMRDRNKINHSLDSFLEGCQVIGFDWHCVYVNDPALRHERHTGARSEHYCDLRVVAAFTEMLDENRQE